MLYCIPSNNDTIFQKGGHNYPIYKIAAAISNGDAAILSDISECLLHTLDYFGKHLENYKNRGMDEKCKTNKIQWIGYARENGYRIDLACNM